MSSNAFLAQNFIFDTVGFQNSGNTVFNYVKNFNATNNAAITGNTFKFQSDRDRMYALTGAQAQPSYRTSGYSNFLYTTFYNMTVTTPTLPSSNGPGNSGWGVKLGSGAFNPIQINNSFLQKNTGKSDYVAVAVSGYLYVPAPITGQIQTFSDDGVVGYVNNVKVLDNWTYHGGTTDTSSVFTLQKGYNPITVYYFEGVVDAAFQLAFKLGDSAFTNNQQCLCYHNYNQL
jgi:hypothetical protein